MGSISNFATSPFFLILFGRMVLTLLVTSFFVGCGTSLSSSSKSQPKANATPTPRKPEALIYADEAMLKKPFAVIGGTVENVSGTKLEDVTVEFELQRRSDGSKERRTLKLNPPSLEPGERGIYSFKILSDEWSDSRIISLRSHSRTNEIGFRTLLGARRPPERLPDKTSITRVVQAPNSKKKSGGEEFINTPDNPVNVP